MSLGRIVGPLWAGTAFDYNMSLPYVTGAIIMGVGLVTTIFWLTCRPKTEIELDISKAQV
jgi:hypothetical protein